MNNQSVNRPLRVSIVGATIWGNRGAEAMLETVIGLLKRRFPDVEVTVLTYYPLQDSKLCKDPNIEMLDFKPVQSLLSVPLSLFSRISGKKNIPLFSSLMNSDIALDISGVSFIHGKGLANVYHAVCQLPFIVAGVPLVKLSQALGPFESIYDKQFATLFLETCEAVFARGAETKKELDKLRLSNHVVKEAPDLGFLFEEEFSLSLENEARVKETEQQIDSLSERSEFLAALCPSSLVYKKLGQEGGDAYLDLFVAAHREIVSKGGGSVLLPHATREGSDETFNNDLPALLKLKEKLLGEGSLAASLVVIDYDLPAAKIWNCISKCQIGVVSRFHAMIGSLSSGVPVSVIGWSHKYKEVLDTFGLSDYAFDSKDDSTRVLEGVRRLIEKRSAEGDNVVRILPEVRKQAMGQIDFVYEKLANSSRYNAS